MLLLLVHQHNPHHKQQIVPFNMLCLVCGINSVLLSINLIPVSISDSPLPAPVTSSFSSSVSPSLFHCRLKTHLFHKSFLPWTLFLPQDCFHGLLPGVYLLSKLFFKFFSSFLYFWLIKLAIISILAHVERSLLCHIVCDCRHTMKR